MAEAILGRSQNAFGRIGGGFGSARLGARSLECVVGLGHFENHRLVCGVEGKLRSGFCRDGRLVQGVARSEVEEQPSKGSAGFAGLKNSRCLLVQADVRRKGSSDNRANEARLVFKPRKIVVGLDIQIPSAATVGGENRKHRVVFGPREASESGCLPCGFPRDACASIVRLGEIDEFGECQLFSRKRLPRSGGYAFQSLRKERS